MNRCWMVLVALLFIEGTSGRALSDNATILKEIQSMKERIAELEQKLEEQETLSNRQAAKTEKQIGEKIEETLEERFGTLSLHGGAVLYYQGSQVHQLEGENADSPSGAGFTGDLELTWKPGAPVIENGEFYARVHAGKGTGADRGGNANNPVNVLLADLNTLTDDNSGDNDDTSIRLLEARYTHAFLDGMASATGGKLKLEYFMDQNEFANCEKSQFVGKPFVNNSVFDSENEYAPVLGGTFKPAEFFALSLVAGSTSRPLLEDTPLSDKQKSKYDNVFSTPLLGAQATFAPKIGELKGNYRFYGWSAGYEHSKLDRDRNPIAGKDAKGWGLALSADQQVTEKVGLFCRLGYNNKDVYVTSWEASGGLDLKGLIPGRAADNLGLGVAALIPDSRYNENDPEYHLELYYRVAVTEHLAFSPDLQYVWNPGGDSSNDGIFAGMLRAEFGF
jgi:Carbohydrate-selective porin, OprB family